MRLLVLASVGAVLTSAIFCATSSYARRETLTGSLVPQGGLIRITARQGGMVEQLNVVEGQSVKAGLPLAVLRTSMDIRDGDTGSALVRDVALEAHALDVQDQATQARLGAQVARLRAERASLVRERDATKARLAALEERARLAQNNVDRFNKMAVDGFVSRRDLENARSTSLAMLQDAAEVRTLALGYERQITDIDAQLKAAPFDARVAAAQSKAARAEVMQKGTSAALQATYIATSPVSGRVGAVPVDLGQTVSVGSTIAVVSGGGDMEAELYAPSRAAGFIKPGQEVRLMYQAFPHQKFGAARGHIRSVSRTVLAPSELTVAGMTVQEPVFRVKVALDKQTMSAYGQELPLRAGMLANADVIVDRRTLLEWLLDPLYAAGRR
ncbi:MAG: HlyD family efflux transporter periplasmic adaptor subunit [Caulobacter sp.]|nr:HlyD family efflux transporter periplasmic adaptor subunit [Caulobacter sp.]